MELQIEMFMFPSERVIWTDQDVLVLRESLLYEALEVIRDLRKSKSMRDDAWSWLFAIDDSSPLSAQACAQCTGYNIDLIQRELLTHCSLPI